MSATRKCNEDDVPEVDLDFHVEFPTPGENSQCDVIWPCENGTGGQDEKQVLVILLGWAGAQDKYLKKYSDFYLQRGCIVLRYITPIQALFVTVNQLPILARRFVRLLRDLNLTAHPTFFHVFSNGGSFMYSNIVKEVAIQKNSSEFNFKGVIFDSAPAPRNLGSCYGALTNIFAGFNVFRYVVAAFVILWLVGLTFWHHFKLAFQFCVMGEYVKTPASINCIVTPDPLQDWLTRIRQIQRHSFAFIYSDQDDLIPGKKVEQTAKVLKERGNYVTMVKFEGSEHVQHYRAYPQEYIDAVTKFITTTMNRNAPSPIFWDEAN